MTISEARPRLADVIDQARVEHDPMYLTRRGRPIAAIIGTQDLERLQQAAADLEALTSTARGEHRTP